MVKPAVNIASPAPSRTEYRNFCLRVIQRRARKLFEQVEAYAETRVAGPIEFTDRPTERYATVSNDPDRYFSSDPEWQGEPPRYRLWVGADDNDIQMVMRTFYFSLAHETMHVASEMRWASPCPPAQGVDELRLLGELAVGNASELEIDCMAKAFFLSSQYRAMSLWSMVGFSSLVLFDFRNERIPSIRYSSAAREIVKLRWVAGNLDLPERLRREAMGAEREFFAVLAGKKADWKEREKDLTKLCNLYYPIFARDFLTSPATVGNS